MSKSTLSVTALLVVAGCATADTSDIQPGNDAPNAIDAFTRTDAPLGDPDAPLGDPDAPQQIDAPQQQIDAPAGACSDATSGVLATWDFSGDTGSQTTTPVTSNSTGLVVGDLSRSSGLVASTGSNSMNSSGFPTSTSKTGYYTLTLTPPSGCELDITSMSIEEKSSGTGPSKGAVGTSVDDFGTTASITMGGCSSCAGSGSATSTPTLSVTDQTAAVEIRIFGESATSSSGTMRLSDTLTVSGALH